MLSSTRPSESPFHLDPSLGALSATTHEHTLPDSPEMSIRSLVTSKEAGIIIGKGGSYISQIRQSTGVRVGISAVVDSSVERTLTMVGPIIKIAKVLWIIQAYSMIAQNFLDNYNPNTPPPVPTTTSIRLLVAHQLIGSVIGKAGSKIKDIQEKSGAKIVVSKGMLVDSTERVVEVLGLVDSMYFMLI